MAPRNEKRFLVSDDTMAQITQAAGLAFPGQFYAQDLGKALGFSPAPPMTVVRELRGLGWVEQGEDRLNETTPAFWYSVSNLHDAVPDYLETALPGRGGMYNSLYRRAIESHKFAADESQSARRVAEAKMWFNGLGPTFVENGFDFVNLESHALPVGEQSPQWFRGPLGICALAALRGHQELHDPYGLLASRQL